MWFYFLFQGDGDDVIKENLMRFGQDDGVKILIESLFVSETTIIMVSP